LSSVFAKDIPLIITLPVRFANDQRLPQRRFSIFALNKNAGMHKAFRRLNTDCRFLKGEINSRPGHSEIVVRPIDYVPTEIRDPTDVRRDSNFKAAAKLAHASALAFISHFAVAHATHKDH
jgi:hypothetical protein